MAKGANYAAKAEEIASPLAAELGLALVDVEFLKEGPNYYLRIYIDKDGGVAIDDCEALSRAVEAELDARDAIEPAYILEVSSPGLDRPIKKDKDFERYSGRLVEIKLYKPVDGVKELSAELVGLDTEGFVIVKDEAGEELSFKRSDIASIRLAVIF